jgi:hypothetical protein
VIVGGAPLRGTGGYVGELGHMVVNPQGRSCYCGCRGCWETEVCEAALRRALRLPADTGRGKLIAELRELAADPPVSLARELVELAHTSIRQYQRANGEVIALLVIAPSKTDTERLLPHVARVVPGHRDDRGPANRARPIPLVPRYDGHERVWTAPMPYLFPRQIGGVCRVASTGTILNNLRRRCQILGERSLGSCRAQHEQGPSRRHAGSLCPAASTRGSNAACSLSACGGHGSAGMNSLAGSGSWRLSPQAGRRCGCALQAGAQERATALGLLAKPQPP